MKKIFEEYGGVIHVALAIVALVGVVAILVGGANGGVIGGAFKSTVDKFGDKVDEAISDVGDGNAGNLLATDESGNVVKYEFVSLAKGADKNSKLWSDFTFVGDNLWVFFGSGDETHTAQNGMIRIYNPDTGELMKSFFHDFGHVNTVDYNESTDQLLIGNAPGNDEYPAAIYVMDDVRSWFDEEAGSTFLFADKLSTIVDVSAIVREGTTHAFATTACWGEDDDTIYINGSYNRYWWKVILGTGTNNLGKGTYAAAPDGVFNGSYQTIWMKQFALSYSANQECVQGIVYVNGQIHTANGHNEVQWWEWTANDDGMSRDEHNIAPINEDGSIKYCISEGITARDGYIYVGCLFTDRGSDNYAENHGTCTGDYGFIKIKIK